MRHQYSSREIGIFFELPKDSISIRSSRLKHKNAYISGALSVAPGKVRLEVLYDKIGELCEKKGIKAFIPYRDANPGKIEDFSNTKLYESNMAKLKNDTDLLICYVGLPSTGTGMEVQEACHVGIDVIILSEKEAPVSKPLQGCPGVKAFIRFTDFDDAMKQLEEVLDRI